MDQYSVEVRNLTKTFGPIIAVDNLNLTVSRGEIFGLLGPNGAGKTTTIQMICGLLRPDSGQIYLEGKSVRPGNGRLMHQVGVCTQQNILWEKLTCIEQLEFMGEMYHLHAEDARHRGELLLERIGLGEKRNTLASRLSGGMQRRLNLAMALIHDPQVLVLDEPETGLDPQSRILVREYICEMAHEKTIILTTHNMDEADRLADRVAIIDHGKLLVVDTPEGLKKTVGNGDVVELEIDSSLPDEVPGLLATMDVSCSMADHSLILRSREMLNRLPHILEILEGKGVRVGEVHIRTNTLEDVFISLTGRRLRE